MHQSRFTPRLSLDCLHQCLSRLLPQFSLTQLKVQLLNLILTFIQAITLDLSKSDLSAKQQQQLHSLLNEFRDIFAFTNAELGRTSIVYHRIDTGNSPPIRLRAYRVSDKQRQVIEECVDDMLERGVIEPSNSP